MLGMGDLKCLKQRKEAPKSLFTILVGLVTGYGRRADLQLLSLPKKTQLLITRLPKFFENLIQKFQISLKNFVSYTEKMDVFHGFEIRTKYLGTLYMLI